MKFLLIYVAIVIAIVVGVNQLLEKPLTAPAKAKKIIPPRFEKSFTGLTAKDTSSWAYHDQILTHHFSKPFHQATPTANIYRNDKVVEAYYDYYADHKNRAMRDIGNFGLGIIYTHTKRLRQANAYFNKINIQSVKYLSNAQGELFLKGGAAALAEPLFKEEIRRKGAVEKARSNLITALYRQQKIDDLSQLLTQPEYAPHFAKANPNIRSDIYFSQGQIRKYAQTRFRIKTNETAIIASLFVTLIWLIYLLQIKCFIQISFVWLSICFTMATLSALLALPLYDFYRLVLGFDLTGGFFNDFLYAVLGIGLIEESVKFLPVLIVLWAFPKVIKEPVDYIILASVAALGFATTENLMYMAKDSANIIHHRAFFSVVSHLFDSSVIAYGLILARYRQSKPMWLQGMLYLGIAAFAHGFFDFWLINPIAQIFYLFTFGFMVVSMALWMSFMNNALNISPVFDYQKTFSSIYMKRFLMISLTAVLLFDYVSTAVGKGAETANAELYDTMFFAGFFMTFLSTSLANFDLVQGYWQPLYKTSFFQKLNYNGLIGQWVHLESKKNPELATLLPDKLLIGKREVFDNETRFFRIDLPEKINVGDKIAQTIVIYIKSKKELIEYKENTTVEIFLDDNDILNNPNNTIYRKDKLSFWAHASAILTTA